MAKNGSSFPDLSGDGRTTRKDILIGRGVELKRGGKVKKRVKKFVTSLEELINKPIRIENCYC